MDAAWLMLAIAAAGATLNAQTLETTGDPDGAIAARGSIDADLLPRKHSESPRGTSATRQTVYQPITGAQLESGFSQATQQLNTAGQNLNQFGQTLQSSSADAQRAFTTTQQQFADAQRLTQAATEPQRTIGGELREGAGRLFNRTKTALEKTGDAIGGTARNLRNALPGRRNQANAATPTVGGVATGGFQPYNYQNPTPPAGGFAAGPGANTTAAPATTPTTSGGFGFPAAAGNGSTTSAAGGFATSTTTPAAGTAGDFANNNNAAAVGRSTLTPVPPPFISTSTAPAAINGGSGQPFGGPSATLLAVPPATPSWTSTPPADYRNLNQGTAPEIVNNRRGAGDGLGAPDNSSAILSVLDNPSNSSAPQTTPPTNLPSYPAWGQPTPGTVAGGGFADQQAYPDQPQPADPYRQTAALPADPYAQPGYSQPPYAQPPYTQPPYTQPTPPLGPGANQFAQQPYASPAPPLASPAGPANLQPPFQTTSQFVTADGTREVLPPSDGRDPREPWKELVFATVVALGSVGGNLFLGWSYLDARNKYRTALRRTTRTFGLGNAAADA